MKVKFTLRDISLVIINQMFENHTDKNVGRIPTHLEFATLRGMSTVSLHLFVRNGPL
jgi:hypothetical protein